jgi:Rrf2 family protein
MVELARHHGDGPVSLAEMAEHEDLPRPYLEQLAVSLRSAGLVVSTRGARGGYQLARDPSHIRMGEVVTALEGPIVPMICAGPQPHPAELCERSGFCSVHGLWVRVRDAVSAALDATTLEELARPLAGHPCHAMPVDSPGAASPVLVAVRPLGARPTKESIAQP